MVSGWILARINVSSAWSSPSGSRISTVTSRIPDRLVAGKKTAGAVAGLLMDLRNPTRDRRGKTSLSNWMNLPPRSEPPELRVTPVMFAPGWRQAPDEPLAHRVPHHADDRDSPSCSASSSRSRDARNQEDIDRDAHQFLGELW